MTEFDEIIDFAISREKEAVDFYRELQAIAKFKAQKEVLASFEQMEHSHVKMLEGVKARQGMKERKYPKVDLKLADFLVQAEPAADMSYQDIIITAIKKEELSTVLYKKLAAEAPEAEASEIFESLAAQEAAHKNHFEVIYDEEILSDN